jgi:hypothetical protein
MSDGDLLSSYGYSQYIGASISAPVAGVRRLGPASGRAQCLLEIS